MNTTYKLVELAKEKTGIDSDYGIAKLIGVTSQKMSNWKTNQSEGNAINTLKLIKAAGLNIDDALKLMTEQPRQAQLALNTASSVYIMLNHCRKKITAAVDLGYLLALLPRPQPTPSN